MPIRPVIPQAPLQLPSLSANARRSLLAVWTGLPIRFGSPVSVCILPSLTSCSGRLLSGEPHRGIPVHAAAFLRQRRVILESELLTHPRQLRLIFAHECFHFVWPRLGNSARHAFAALIRKELLAGARGELGESAFAKKSSIEVTESGRRWRDYVCEAFCDTGAHMFSRARVSGEPTLAARWLGARRAWFEQAIDWEAKCF